MTKEDVVQIRVESYAVGIIGLNTALEDMAAAYAEKPDPENGQVKSVGKVPPRARLIQWLEEANTKQAQTIRRKE